MNNYRRKNQITDEEINTFKEIEINKINQKIPTSKLKKAFPWQKLATSGMAFAIVAMVFLISFYRETPLQTTYTFTQVGPMQYTLTSEQEDYSFKLFYDFDVVQLGEQTNYNELFDYFVPYNYPPQETIDAINTSLNAFKYDRYRYFLESTINDEKTYLEVNYFCTQSIHKILDGLEIDDLKTDINNLYALIDKYPPVLIDEGPPSPVYESHPNINQLEDSLAKRNYIIYVENYYVGETYYCNEQTNESREENLTVQLRHIAVVDAHGTLLDTHHDYMYAFGINPALPYTTNHNSFFDFYPVGETRHNYMGTHYDVNEALSGWLKVQEFPGDTLYLYMMIYLLEDQQFLKNTNYLEITYTLSETLSSFTKTFIHQSFIYNEALIVPPMDLGDEALTQELYSAHEIFTSITLNFYDSDDQLIYEFNLILQASD